MVAYNLITQQMQYSQCFFPQFNSEMQESNYFELNYDKQNEKKDTSQTSALCLNDLEAPIILSTKLFSSHQSLPAEMLTQKPQKYVKRNKNFIQLSSRAKKLYLNAKKGRSGETNDLTLHTFSLIKSSFKEFQTFFCSDESQLKILQEFKNIKGNLKNLQAFMHAIQQSQLYENEGIKMQNAQEESWKSGLSFHKFLCNYLDSCEIIKKILARPKMNFNKKQMMIRFLPAIKKLVIYPKDLKRWKQFLHQSHKSTQ